MPPPHFASLPVVPRWKSLRNSITLAANPIPVLNNYLDTYGDTIVVYLGAFGAPCLPATLAWCSMFCRKTTATTPSPTYRTALRATSATACSPAKAATGYSSVA
ncbi:hypothetical protein [Hymenobacter qilianensis]|uniref:hypothetical protein n=1 Tax=Hymenobacter qilianensis TaxID=1385715 RepID=UPI001CB89F4C|nr:hypothetical protein [Hymenobacter qilianensis]